MAVAYYLYKNNSYSSIILNRIRVICFLFIFIEVFGQQQTYPDTLYLNYGSQIPCFIYETHTTFICLYKGVDIAERTATIAVIDSISIDNHIIVNARDDMFVAEIENVINHRPNTFQKVKKEKTRRESELTIIFMPAIGFYMHHEDNYSFFAGSINLGVSPKNENIQTGLGISYMSRIGEEGEDYMPLYFYACLPLVEKEVVPIFSFRVGYNFYRNDEREKSGAFYAGAGLGVISEHVIFEALLTRVDKLTDYNYGMQYGYIYADKVEKDCFLLHLSLGFRIK